MAPRARSKHPVDQIRPTGLEFHTRGLEGEAMNLSLCLLLNRGLIQKRLVWGLCAQKSDWQSAKSMYDFHALDIDGQDVSLEIYRGMVCIITNVATQ
uniref:Uncharacterized protein n=1 Tax=Laticauda laticaudata TaxID=8630 RepID=A0A8C5RV47_LATLA